MTRSEAIKKAQRLARTLEYAIITFKHDVGEGEDLARDLNDVARSLQNLAQELEES